jgi:hypothetical protein
MFLCLPLLCFFAVVRILFLDNSYEFVRASFTILPYPKGFSGIIERTTPLTSCSNEYSRSLPKVAELSTAHRRRQLKIAVILVKRSRPAYGMPGSQLLALPDIGYGISNGIYHRIALIANYNYYVPDSRTV